MSTATSQTKAAPRQPRRGAVLLNRARDSRDTSPGFSGPDRGLQSPGILGILQGWFRDSLAGQKARIHGDRDIRDSFTRYFHMKVLCVYT